MKLIKCHMNRKLKIKAVKIKYCLTAKKFWIRELREISDRNL